MSCSQANLGPDCKAISLIKGIEFEAGGPKLISNIIKDNMGGMDTSVREHY